MLMRFHREIVIPDIERIVDGRVDALRRETLSHFDAVYKLFDRLESQHYALSAAVRRLEERAQSGAP